MEGFSPELAVVTHGGGKLLWQKGHTAHAAREEAHAYALRILDDVYAEAMVEELAVPVFRGRKTGREKFAGAEISWSCEGVMGVGKRCRWLHLARAGAELRPRVRDPIQRPGRSAALCLADIPGCFNTVVGDDDHGPRRRARAARPAAARADASGGLCHARVRGCSTRRTRSSTICGSYGCGWGWTTAWRSRSARESSITNFGGCRYGSSSVREMWRPVRLSSRAARGSRRRRWRCATSSGVCRGCWTTTSKRCSVRRPRYATGARANRKRSRMLRALRPRALPGSLGALRPPRRGAAGPGRDLGPLPAAQRR